MGAAESSEDSTLQEALRVQPNTSEGSNTRLSGSQTAATGSVDASNGQTAAGVTTSTQPKIQQPTPVKPISQKAPATATPAASDSVAVSVPVSAATNNQIRSSNTVPAAVTSLRAATTIEAPKAQQQSQPQSQSQSQSQPASAQPSAAVSVVGPRGSSSVAISANSTTPTVAAPTSSAAASTQPSNIQSQTPVRPASNPVSSSVAPSTSTPAAALNLNGNANSSSAPSAQPPGKPSAVSAPSLAAAGSSTLATQGTGPSSTSALSKPSQPPQTGNVGSQQTVPGRPIPTSNGSAPLPASTTTTKSTVNNNHVSGGPSVSSVANGVPSESSDKVLADAEVAAMEEFILKEAKAHSSVYEHPLWYELVEWASKFMPSDIVLAYEHHIIAYQILSISKLDKFKKKLEELWTQRKNKKRQIAHINTQMKSATLPDDQRAKLTNELIELQSSGNSSGSDHQYEIPYEFARQLLELDKQLAVVRKDFVPGRISEEQFWFIFFDTLISSVQAHVISTQHKVKQQHINMH